MATPYEWMQSISACVVTGITSVDGVSAPGRIEYANTAGLPSAECGCDGYLFINAGPISLGGGDAPFPNPRIVTEPLRNINDTFGIATFIAQYRTCVPVEGDTNASAPTVEAVNASAQTLWDTGWAAWQHALCCIRDWGADPQYGRVNLGQLTPVRRQGGCGGWDIPFIVRLRTCPECE